MEVFARKFLLGVVKLIITCLYDIDIGCMTDAGQFIKHIANSYIHAWLVLRIDFLDDRLDCIKAPPAAK